MSEIARNLAQVKERIGEAALKAGRDPDEVTLVAISKTFPAADVVTAYHAGVRHFGENRVKEGLSKIQAVNAAIDAPPPTWHMVGHVQSRKARMVVGDFDYVHSVDRLKIARRFDRYVQEANGDPLPVLVECNVSGEKSKYGFDANNWETDSEQRERVISAIETLLALPGIAVQGLMTMAPFVDDAETVRPVFASLRTLLGLLRERFPQQDWRHLSMGMTNDFEVAVQEGATMVRVGRAIFGARP